MSLAELTYDPATLYNIRKTKSSIELIITDFAILTWIKKEIFYFSWEFVKEPKHVFQPGLLTKYYTWVKSVLPKEYPALISTLYLIPMKGIPGNVTNFDNFKSENCDQSCLRLYVY